MKRIMGLVMSAGFLVILSFGCSDKQQAGSQGVGAGINTSVSGTPNAALFDVWTLTATLQSSTICPLRGEVVSEAQEEYRFITGSGSECTVDDENADGSDLTNNEFLFDDERTRCRVGGNDIVLQQGGSNQVADADCTLTTNTVARMTIATDGQTLTGTMESSDTTSGTQCPEELTQNANCTLVIVLAGRKGRFAPPLEDSGTFVEEAVEPPSEMTPSMEVTPESSAPSDVSGGEAGGEGEEGDMGGGEPIPEVESAITFADSDLNEFVRRQLGLFGDAPLTTEQCARLTRLELVGVKRRISDLSGLECAAGLTYLDLSYNNISDLTPLAELTNLRVVKLDHNLISDISALRNLTQITTLDINNNNLATIVNLRETFRSITKLIRRVDVRTNPSLFDVDSLVATTSVVTWLEERGVIVND